MPPARVVVGRRFQPDTSAIQKQKGRQRRPFCFWPGQTSVKHDHLQIPDAGYLDHQVACVIAECGNL
jgi:hypothetical protein